MSPPGKCMEMPVEMSELKSCMSKSGVTNYTCDEVTRTGPKGNDLRQLQCDHMEIEASKSKNNI